MPISSDSQQLMQILGPHTLTPWRDKLHPPEILSNVLEAVCRFTPALCKSLLETRNPKNRPINMRKVQKLRNALREGLWNPCQPDSTVVFGEDGFIKNCQHRLTMCVVEDMDFISRVEIGHPDNILLLLDQTEPRTEAQQAAIIGRKKAERQDYASVKMLWMLQNQKTYFPFERGSKTFDLIDHVYPPSIWDIVPVELGGIRLVYSVRASLLLLAITWPEEVTKFVSQIRDVQFVKNTGPWLLHHYLVQGNIFQTEKQTYEGRMAIVRRTFKAFHLFLEGKTVTKLRDSNDSVAALMLQVDPAWEPIPDGPFDPTRKKTKNEDAEEQLNRPPEGSPFFSLDEDSHASN